MMINDPPASLAITIYMHDLSGGGVERQMLALAEKLQLLGAAVTLVLHSLDGDLRANLPDTIPIHCLGGKRTLQDIPRLAAYLRRHRPDILLANVDHNNVAALLAKSLALSPTKVVIVQHSALSPQFTVGHRWTYRMIGHAYRSLAPLVTAAIAVSQGVARELAGVLPERKIHVIHNPVVGDDFATRMHAPVTHPWFDDGQPVLVTAGRLVPPKDHATLLRGLAIHRRQHNTRLLLLGAGPMLDDLTQLAGELGIADAVDFLGFQPNPLPYLRRASCFAMTSVSEGFGNVIVEAMGCGTPVISTDCPHGPREILDNGRFGVLVPTADPEALASAMAETVRMRDRFPAKMLRDRADEFTEMACAQRFHALFRRIMEPACHTHPVQASTFG